MAPAPASPSWEAVASPHPGIRSARHIEDVSSDIAPVSCSAAAQHFLIHTSASVDNGIEAQHLPSPPAESIAKPFTVAERIASATFARNISSSTLPRSRSEPPAVGSNYSEQSTRRPTCWPAAACPAPLQDISTGAARRSLTPKRRSLTPRSLPSSVTTFGEVFLAHQRGIWGGVAERRGMMNFAMGVCTEHGGLTISQRVSSVGPRHRTRSLTPRRSEGGSRTSTPVRDRVPQQQTVEQQTLERPSTPDFAPGLPWQSQVNTVTFQQPQPQEQPRHDFPLQQWPQSDRLTIPQQFQSQQQLPPQQAPQQLQEAHAESMQSQLEQVKAEVQALARAQVQAQVQTTQGELSQPQQTWVNVGEAQPVSPTVETPPRRRHPQHRSRPESDGPDRRLFETSPEKMLRPVRATAASSQNGYKNGISASAADELKAAQNLVRAMRSSLALVSPVDVHKNAVGGFSPRRSNERQSSNCSAPRPALIEDKSAGCKMPLSLSRLARQVASDFPQAKWNQASGQRILSQSQEYEGLVDKEIQELRDLARMEASIAAEIAKRQRRLQQRRPGHFGAAASGAMWDEATQSQRPRSASSSRASTPGRHPRSTVAAGGIHRQFWSH